MLALQEERCLYQADVNFILIFYLLLSIVYVKGIGLQRSSLISEERVGENNILQQNI